MKTFYVADITPRGDLQSKTAFEYAQLEQHPVALDLITEFSTYLWRSPEEFEIPLPTRLHMVQRWRASSETTGVSTLRWRGQVVSLSLIASGKDPEADSHTLGAFQQHLLNELHDTGFEPSFGLLNLTERPLAATISLLVPPEPEDREIFALADRCFAASYFRRLGLA